MAAVVIANPATLTADLPLQVMRSSLAPVGESGRLWVLVKAVF